MSKFSKSQKMSILDAKGPKGLRLCSTPKRNHTQIDENLPFHTFSPKPIIGTPSKVFKLGLITYSNDSKNTILKVPKKIIKKFGAVSIQCCLAMVNNLKKISKSDVSVSITGIAGPKGGTKSKPVGLVFIGIKKANKVSIYKCFFKNKGRSYIQKATVRKSLDLILRVIK